MATMVKAVPPHSIVGAPLNSLTHTVHVQHKTSNSRTDNSNNQKDWRGAVRVFKKTHPAESVEARDSKNSLKSKTRRQFRKNISSMSMEDGKTTKPNLTVDTAAADDEYYVQKTRRRGKNRRSMSPNSTPTTASSTPSTGRSNITITPSVSPNGQRRAKIRGKSDLRSPGIKATPTNATNHNQHTAKLPSQGQATVAKGVDNGAPIPDFITQTDKYGNATTPRNSEAVMRKKYSSSNGIITQHRGNYDENGGNNHNMKSNGEDDDQCDSLLETIRMMCCCIMVEDQQRQISGSPSNKGSGNSTTDSKITNGRTGYSTRSPGSPMLLPTDANDPNRVRLLPKMHPEDTGKKCLVLDLDETLVHSSFRAVPGADFVIPVQIEDVVHFVYVAKRPGADEFLLEMAKHYEIIVYTASLNKYADPLLDLLDPHRVIRTRLFRESCVYYEGNYVKDLSLLDRDLTQTIIVDNSPSSYIFHPENAIDCSSFIDDPNDRELDQIGSFLAGIKDVNDVRTVCSWWRSWPDIEIENDEPSLDSFGR